MKIHLTWMTTILCVCFLTVSSFSQTDAESKPEEIAKLIEQAMRDKQDVVITVKPGVCLDCLGEDKHPKKSQKITGRISEVSATRFTLANDKRFEQFWGKPSFYGLGYEDVQAIRIQNKTLRRLRYIGERGAAIGSLPMIPLFLFIRPWC